MRPQRKDWFLWIGNIVVFFVSLGYFGQVGFERYSDLITFLSILIGFKLTFVATIFTSPLKRELYEAKDDEYYTKLHRLRSCVQKSLTADFIFIVLIFIVPDKSFNISINSVNFPVGLFGIVGPLIWTSGRYFFLLSGYFFSLLTYPTNEN